MNKAKVQHYYRTFPGMPQFKAWQKLNKVKPAYTTVNKYTGAVSVAFKD